MDGSFLIYSKATVPWLGLEPLEGLFNLNFSDSLRDYRFKLQVATLGRDKIFFGLYSNEFVKAW